MGWRSRVSSFVGGALGLVAFVLRHPTPRYHPHNCRPQFEGADSAATPVNSTELSRSDIEVIAFNLPQIQFGNRE